MARTLGTLDGYAAAESTLAELRSLMQHLHEAQSHDVRQENTLFPLLERYGVEEPPAIMWAEHNRMKATRDVIDTTILGAPDVLPYAQFAQVLAGAFQHWLETFVQHAKKEQEILYNVALDLLSPKDWQDLEQESQKLGFFALPEEDNR
ncbi:MAG: hemerythrin domain-containing protein [Patescibacteria group bacterium]